jgi:serine/threonine protein kinase
VPDVNEIINGYQLRNLLHNGAHTQVFEVVETAGSRRHFAMKLIIPASASDPEQRAMLFNEADIGIKLKHDNVVGIVKVHKQATNPNFVMQFFPAGSLGARLRAKDMDFLKQHARKIFKEAATGLAYMNSMGYVHRDIKPDNILSNQLGETRIIDFAISKKRERRGFFSKLFRKKGKPQGTPSYMSPEQINDDPVDERADIYSFGCTMYELLTGRPPFRGTTTADLLKRHLTEKPAPPASYNNDIMSGLDELIVSMIEKKREDRPRKFHEVLMEMKKIPFFKSVREAGRG